MPLFPPPPPTYPKTKGSIHAFPDSRNCKKKTLLQERKKLLKPRARIRFLKSLPVPLGGGGRMEEKGKNLAQETAKKTTEELN